MLRVLVKSPSALVRYGFAAIAASLAFLAAYLLDLRDRPFLIPMLGVLLSAARGGFGPGLLAGCLTIVFVDYTWLGTPGTLTTPTLTDAWEFVLFAAVAATISLLTARGRRIEQTLEATLASIGDGVIVTDSQATITFMNAVAQQLTGWTTEAAVGQPIDRVFAIVHEETGAGVENPALRALRGGIVVQLANHTALVARDGSTRPVEDSAAPIRDDRGRTIGAVLVFRDVSARRAHERALADLLERERTARSQAEQANRLKDDFLATLSHELRTPLNAVLGWAHMLVERRLPTSDQERHAYDAIYRNALAQTKLVEDVLDVSRIVTGRLQVTPQRINLSELAGQTADSFAPAIRGRRQTLTLQLATDAYVQVDPDRMRQVIWNLVSNAMKFTPDDGRVTIAVERTGTDVLLRVSDTGVGIAPEFLPYVFEPFRQADSSTTRTHGGLGLGLSLVRRLVEAHGGTVRLDSDGIGHGTSVEVRLRADGHAAESMMDEPLDLDHSHG